MSFVRKIPSQRWLLWLLVAFLSSASLAQESFRFAWLSDTHVGSLTGEEDLRASVQEINSITGLSFVVISGDVTEYGSREQFQLAKAILDGLKIPCHVIPGNHDTKWSESGATDFPRIWKADRFMFEHGGYRFIGMAQGPLMKMSDGHWAPQDVRWLEKTLKESKQPDKPLIFVTHYPIDDGIANWYVVLDLLKQYNLQVALCGHVHRNGTNSYEGVPGVTGRANLRGAAASGGFTLVEVTDQQMFFSEHTIGATLQKPWHSVALRQHDYAADTNTYPRPNKSVNARYPKVTEQWVYNTGFTIASAPAVAGDLVIFGDASGTIYALGLNTGKVQWTLKTGGPVYSTPEIGGELVIVPSTDGSIYALKAATGKEAWRFRSKRPIVASPRFADGVVYVGSSEGKFRALDLRSGKLLWEFDRLDGFVETKPLVREGKVFFGAWDQYLYALDQKSGKLLWKWQGDKPGNLFSPAACWPVGAHGKIFVAAPDRKLTAIDDKTGMQIWRTGSYPVRESLGLSEDKNRLYVRSLQDSIYAFSTSASKPEKLWETNAGFGYDINSAMLIEKGGTVFYGTKNGLLIALDGRTGAIRWQHKFGVGVINTVAPLSADRVLATDFDGRVVLVNGGG